MVDIQSILKDLQEQARGIADKVDVEKQVEQAKDLAKKIKHRVETDPDAQKAAIGGGALLALLLATKNGRKIIGTVAKTGTVAALGAVAYHAWQNRSEKSGPSANDVQDMGYAADDSADPDLSRAIVETMMLAASADRVIDEAERSVIEQALGEGAERPDHSSDLARENAIDRIVLAARTPNHAAQIYAGACIAVQEASEQEAEFLEGLADRLSIHPRHAAQLREANVPDS